MLDGQPRQRVPMEGVETGITETAGFPLATDDQLWDAWIPRKTSVARRISPLLQGMAMPRSDFEKVRPPL